MSSGSGDFKNLSTVSSRLLQIMKQRGRLPMPSLSAYARQALAQLSEAHTSSYQEPSLSRQRCKSAEKRLALKRSQVLSSFSTSDLVELDKRGIKILGIDWGVDNTSTDWAD